MIYEDFHLRLAPDGHDGFQVHASFQEQRASAPLALPSEHYLLGDLRGQVWRGPTRHFRPKADSGVGWTSPEELGNRLFQALLGGEVGRLFNQVHGAFEKDPGRALRLRLHFPPREKRAWLLQSLPWELLYQAEERRFFALSPQLPVVRSLDTSRPLRVLPTAHPLRVLIVMANPLGTTLLNLSAERKKIEDSLSGIDPIEVTLLERATPRELRRKLREGRFHMVHFMGHGVGFDPEAGEGALLLASPEDLALPLSATGFAEFFEGIEAPQLVVLNACETAVTADEVDPVHSVAASLVAAGLPAILAHRAPIHDDAALILAEELYLRLAKGDPIEAAVAEARLALRSERPGTTSWAIPSLFIRPAPAEQPATDLAAGKAPEVPETSPEPPPAAPASFVQNVRTSRVGKQTNIQGEVVHYREDSLGGA